jgi:acetyl-CoA acetyltransferase
VHSVDGVLAKYSLVPALVEDLLYNIVVVGPSVPHMAREIDFRSQFPTQVRALTVTDNCISGTSAIISIRDAIATG